VGVPEDDRQRRQRDRLHLRLRHRPHHRDRGHRPAPHDGRSRTTASWCRGDGAARRMDRARIRDRRGRRHDPDSRSSRCASRRSRTRSSGRHERGRDFSIIVVAEGAHARGRRGAAAPRAEGQADEFGPHPPGRHRGLARGAHRRARPGTRRATACSATSSGAGRPTAFDRVLGSRFGVSAVDLVARGGSAHGGHSRTADRGRAARRERSVRSNRWGRSSTTWPESSSARRVVRVADQRFGRIGRPGAPGALKRKVGSTSSP
jgi:hypothetical protein